jgi:hypothetical protein
VLVKGRPKHLLKKNIGDQVGGWLGGAAKVVGRAAAQNPLVAQNIRYGKAVLAGPTELAKTAAIDLAAGAAGAGLGRALSGVRVVRSVSSAAKQEQKYLAQLEKYYSGKDLKKIQGLKQGNAGEYRFQRAQEAFDDGVSPKLNIDMQRQAVSDAMKSTKGPLKVVKKKSGAIRSVKTSPKKKK